MITSYLTDSEPFQSLVAALRREPQRIYAPSFFQGYLLAALKQALWPEESLLAVAPGAAEASRMAADLGAFCSSTPVWLLPSLGAIAGSGLEPSPQVTGQRHRALYGLRRGLRAIVVTDVSAIQEKDLDPRHWHDPVQIKSDSAPAFGTVIKSLAALGYERVDQVEDRGEFAVRGGIIDCFPSTDPSPLRLEYWGDELESLRRFSPFTQLSLSAEDNLTIYATTDREPVTSNGYIEGPAVSNDGARGAEEPPMESRGLLAAELFTARVALVDPGLFSPAATALWEDANDALGDSEAGRRYLQPEQLEQQAQAAAAAAIESIASGQQWSFAASGFKFASRHRQEAIDRLRRLVSDGYRVFVHFSSDGAARRAEHVFAGHASLLSAGEAAPADPGAYLVVAPAPAGFVSRELSLAAFGERALLRPERAARAQVLALGGKALVSFRDLTPGDFVVHDDHGIGRFEAVETRTVSGVTRDYLHLVYKGGDALYVPQEQMFKVSRYVGTRESAPPLNKLGGKAWALARSRARSAAREMAGELLQLYAARQSLPGHAFEPDDRWQLEMEAAFPYCETPDQAAAIEDVKDDMESAHPMDRLICGDVGFGKTEVAIRASFKAATQGKQVLMLAPTTILAMQHYKTFRSRFEPYPVKVEMISRFRSPADSRRITREFHEGEIDVLIGTHRLLSADIDPANLGLVIVDEEQRFGVAQKEKLRHLRLKVDVLSLTATPIPRTLQMSLSGIRDISIMETPPVGRNPIRTFVGEYDEDLLVQAINREKERGGQVFFLHNRVESIESVATELRSLVPGARFLVAHGQMPEKELEAVMVSFLDREADVLVCTSIIESGLDIPTANTLIIDRADTLGLAQMYQIRGRIGRSEATAHAYLFYPSFSTPGKESMARLATLSDYTELGSGFRIAMRDLEIRGAGNLLGDEQSGHVAAVGFDMYCDLIKQAVRDYRKEPVEELTWARLDVDADAFIPADYISLDTARIDIHHRVAAARDQESLSAIKAELRDRFGEVPDVVANLLVMQEVRQKASMAGARQVSWRRGRLELAGLTMESTARKVLEDSGLKHAYYPLKKILVVWTGEESDSLSVINGIMDAIMDSLLPTTVKK